MANDYTAHARLSLSATDRWTNCPGSIPLCDNVPRPPSTPASDRGTHVHLGCSTYLEAFLNHKVTGADYAEAWEKLVPEYEEKELENISGYVNTIWEQVMNRSVTNKAWGIEERFVFDDKLAIFGTVDFWCIFLDDKAKRVACIVDYKNGYHYVDEKSGQLKSYACAIRREIRAAGKECDLFRTCIYQPNSSGGECFRCAQFTNKQLDAHEKRMCKAAHDIYVSQKPKFKAGKWCKWCPAQAVCKAYNKEIEVRTQLQIADPNIVFPAPETLEDEKLVMLIQNKKALEAYLDACNAYALNRQLSGKKFAGLKAVLGSSKRGWIADESAVVEGLKALGVPEDKIYSKPKLKGITDIEKIVGKKKNSDGSGKLDALTKKSEAKPCLVGIDDERPEIVNGLDMLSAVESEET